ncbi:MAG: hypothetical protein LAN37_14710 [Acidobacteriia bacterium]|nr:hypothetical protein [Terriglobia bacterium]
MEKELNDLVAKLRGASGANLECVVLYGSAASGHFEEKHSDLNVLCILERLDGAALEALRPVAAWWTGKGQPAVLVFTMDELRRSADVFAIELLDIKASHKVLFGEDCFSGLDVPMNLHRIQLEHELRTKLIRFRQAYLAVEGKSKELLRLMTESISSFMTLFRHTLIALGEPVPPQRHAVLDRLADRLKVEVSAFHRVLEVREGKKADLDVVSVARGYLDTVTRVVDEVDRILAA